MRNKNSLQLQPIINTLFPQLFNHTLSFNVTYFLTSISHNFEKLTNYSSSILPQTFLFAERVMETSLTILPAPPPKVAYHRAVKFHHFFEENVKYSISHCYITFYENYLNINFSI